MQADMVAGGDNQRPGHGSGQIAQGSSAIFDFAQNKPGARQQHRSSLGQTHRPAQSVKQPRIQFAFQRRDPLADRRLGQVQLVSGE